MRINSLVVLSSLLFTQVLSIPAFAEPRVELKPLRCDTADKAEWESDGHYHGKQMCWLRSMDMFPVGGGAKSVGVLLELKDPQLQKVKKLSFEVWFRPQIRTKVKPGVVIEFEEFGVTQLGQFKWGDFGHSDPRGPDREICTKEFKGDGMAIKRILIGGHAIYNHPHTDRLNESPMDVVISNVKVTTASGTLPVSYLAHSETVKSGKDPDALMKKLTPEKF